ncbi:hypothetical protein POCGH01_00101800 [Plasmodium ovale]|uniref:Uncharacterized protein n=1 Tax=Plasmodium ovale TaxID=36330 RepID=A0A1D3JCL4_PLAOA|nr:hypothetical protein POCGH01_00101800 [Plasmodium ovale]
MKVSNKKSNQFPTKHKKHIAQVVHGKSSTLFVNDHDTEDTKELTKCNNNGIIYNLRTHTFKLPLNIYYSNALSKFSILVVLYQVLIFHLAAETEQSSSLSSEKCNKVRGEANESGQSSVFSWKIVKALAEEAQCLFNEHVMCLFRGDISKDCIYSFLRFITIVGGVLLFIGAIFTLLYRYGLCCCKPPSAKKKEEEDDVRKEFEQMQMQMQMQQEQLLRALMTGGPTQEGDDEDDEESEEEEEEEEKDEYNKKKKDKHKKREKNEDNEKQKSSMRTYNTGKTNSTNANIHIGYNRTT